MLTESLSKTLVSQLVCERLTTLLRDFAIAVSMLLSPVELKFMSIGSSSSRVFSPFATAWIARIHSSLGEDVEIKTQKERGVLVQILVLNTN